MWPPRIACVTPCSFVPIVQVRDNPAHRRAIEAQISALRDTMRAIEEDLTELRHVAAACEVVGVSGAVEDAGLQQLAQLNETLTR